MSVEVTTASHFRQIREQFPMLFRSMHGKPLIYFDSAATALKPQSVIDTVTHYYQESFGTVHRAVYELAAQTTQKYNRVRSQVKELLNASEEDEIVFTGGGTEAINLVANCFGKAFLSPGDEVLVSEMEHHSNIVPWQLACQASGAVLKVIPINEAGDICLDEYVRLLHSKTKLVAIAHVSNAIGTVNPVREMVQQAHTVGAKVLIDGAQAVPHMVVDVRDLDADFYTFSPHKAYAPTGVGILYGKKDLLQALPPYQGGGDMIDRVRFEHTTYAEPPLKFEAGTPPIASVMGLGAAIDFLQSVGLSSIYQHEQNLLKKASFLLQSVEGLKIIGNAKKKGGIISFIVDGVHPLDLGTMLDLKGIAIRTGHHCAQPLMARYQIEGSARVSFGLYNTEEEVEQLFQSLQEVLTLLR